MTRPMTVLVLIAAFATPVFGADPTSTARAVDEAFKRHCEAGDVPGVMALYAADAIAVWPGQGEEARGKAGIEKLATNFCKNTKDLKLTMKSIEVRALGPSYIAIVGHWDASFTGPDGKSASAAIRTSEILRKVGAKWLYIVDHASIGMPPPETKP